MKKQYLTPTATLVALPKEEFVTASSLLTKKSDGVYFDDTDNETTGAPIFTIGSYFGGTFD